MNDLSQNCDTCGALIRYPADQAGSSVKCDQCGEPIRLREPPPPLVASLATPQSPPMSPWFPFVVLAVLCFPVLMCMGICSGVSTESKDLARKNTSEPKATIEKQRVLKLDTIAAEAAARDLRSMYEHLSVVEHVDLHSDHSLTVTFGLSFAPKYPDVKEKLMLSIGSDWDNLTLKDGLPIEFRAKYRKQLFSSEWHEGTSFVGKYVLGELTQ